MSSKDEIDTLRAKIATLQAEHRMVSAQRRCRADVHLQVVHIVDHLFQTGTAALATELQRSAAGAHANPFAIRGVVPVAAAPSVADVTLNLGPLLVAMLGKKVVIDALLRSLDDIPLGAGTAVNRAERLAEIEAELDRLETEEEALIESSCLFGEPIARRTDARPEIILMKANDAK